MRSIIANKILSDTSQETRDQTKDYWKGRSDQYEIDKKDIETARKSIKDLLIIANIYYGLPTHNRNSKNAVGKVIEQATQFLK